jgi:hypothetical protein
MLRLTARCGGGLIRISQPNLEQRCTGAGASAPEHRSTPARTRRSGLGPTNQNGVMPPAKGTGPSRGQPRAGMPAAAEGLSQNLVTSPNRTPLEEWPCLASGPWRGPASAETFLKQTGLASPPWLPSVWPGGTLNGSVIALGFFWSLRFHPKLATP